MPFTNLSITDMVRIEDMIYVYFLMRENKRRKNDSVEFEVSYERNMLQLMSEIDDHTLRADANYTFVALYPRIREIFGAKVTVRLVHSYVDWRLRPILENKLTSRTFNNRVGYGSQAAINQLITDIYDVSNGFTTDAYIFKWDGSGYFPNANVDIAFKQINKLIEEEYEGDDKEDLIWMCMICLYSYPQGHCYRKSPIEKWNLVQPRKSMFSKPFGRGAAIGFLIWQNAMNYYVNDIDHYIEDECGLHHIRFVDDNVVVTDNKECMLAMMPILREKYREVDVTINPKKYYCQHYTKGAEFLGSHIKMDRIYLNNKSIGRAYTAIDFFNKLSHGAKYNNIDQFISSLNSFFGMMKGRNEYNNIMKCVNLISKDWFDFVHFNKDKITIEPNIGFTRKDRIIKKYNLKIKNHGSKKLQRKKVTV